ncbi:MAG: carboxypeptidase regulatory-like domain-containing protein [candidate division Zixibacteria bacterium]|nr:carboxypeptidase regulatory-like domain-containing protein [candidate division Zixibacteria bacterium]
MKTLFVVCALLIVAGCSGDNDSTQPISLAPSIDQGVYGQVDFWEGNFMPMPYPENPDGGITPVSRTIFFYEKTTFSDVVPEGYGTFYSEIKTNLIATTESGTDGRYEISLPPGEYSVFVRENDLYYANGSDGEGYIWLVTVPQGETTEFVIEITHAAYF